MMKDIERSERRFKRAVAAVIIIAALAYICLAAGLLPSIINPTFK